MRFLGLNDPDLATILSNGLTVPTKWSRVQVRVRTCRSLFKRAVQDHHEEEDEDLKPLELITELHSSGNHVWSLSSASLMSLFDIARVEAIHYEDSKASSKVSLLDLLETDEGDGQPWLLSRESGSSANRVEAFRDRLFDCPLETDHLTFELQHKLTRNKVTLNLPLFVYQPSFVCQWSFKTAQVLVSLFPDAPSLPCNTRLAFLRGEPGNRDAPVWRDGWLPTDNEISTAVQTALPENPFNADDQARLAHSLSGFRDSNIAGTTWAQEQTAVRNCLKDLHGRYHLYGCVMTPSVRPTADRSITLALD